MGENYITCQGEKGSINISEDVLYSMVRAAVSEIDGVAALSNNAGAELAGEGYALLGGDNDRVLFPGEERTFRFLAIPKRCGGFSQAQNSGGAPALKLHWL